MLPAWRSLGRSALAGAGMFKMEEISAGIDITGKTIGGPSAGFVN